MDMDPTHELLVEIVPLALSQHLCNWRICYLKLLRPYLVEMLMVVMLGEMLRVRQRLNIIMATDVAFAEGLQMGSTISSSSR